MLISSDQIEHYFEYTKKRKTHTHELSHILDVKTDAMVKISPFYTVRCDSMESNWSETKLFLRGASREFFSEDDDGEEDSHVRADSEGFVEYFWPSSITPPRKLLEDSERTVMSGM